MKINNNIIKLALIIHGNVQGVGYRVFVRGIANKYNIKGLTRNVSNGSVEILAIGVEENLNKFINNINVSTKYGISVFNIEKYNDENILNNMFKLTIINQDKFIIEKTRLIEDK